MSDVFAVGDIMGCVFGSRVRPQNVPLGTALEDYYWYDSVRINQVIKCRKQCKGRRFYIYIVESTVDNVIGVGVRDTHNTIVDQLNVPYHDIHRYVDADDRNVILQKLRNELLSE